MFHGPAYVALVYGMVKRCAYVRPLALIWAGVMLGGVIPVFAYSLGMEGSTHPSPNPSFFLLGYGSFIAMPLVVIARFAAEGPIFEETSGETRAPPSAGKKAKGH
jgi:hypothetical protein